MAYIKFVYMVLFGSDNHWYIGKALQYGIRCSWWFQKMALCIPSSHNHYVQFNIWNCVFCTFLNVLHYTIRLGKAIGLFNWFCSSMKRMKTSRTFSAENFLSFYGRRYLCDCVYLFKCLHLIFFSFSFFVSGECSFTLIHIFHDIFGCRW